MHGPKIFGHSPHPMLIVFPLGLLAAAVVFDLVYWFAGGPTFATVSYWMIISGLVGGVLAAIFGFIDWMSIEWGTRAKTIGIAHAAANIVVMLLFAVSWYLRTPDPSQPTTLATVLAVAGAGVSLVGGWLGGELVERLGVGVHNDANPNAPSSLKVSRMDTQVAKPKGV